MTPSANLNPMAALQAQPTGKNQPGQATENGSFSQALSNEIAQKKSNEAKQNESRSEARKAAESRSEPAPPDSAAAQNAAPTETDTRDPLKTAATENSAPQPDGQPAAAATPLLPDAMLAMAAAPALLTPPPAPAGNTTETEPALLAHAPVLPASLSAPAPATLADPLADAAANADAQPTARQSAKTDFQAAMTPTSAQATATAAAAALPERMAAALSPDALKPDEARADSVGNPLMSAAQLVTLSTASAPTTSAASNALAPSVGSAAWSQALGEKIVWMTAGALQTASLTLNPPNLGPLQVVLNVTNDQATASFFAAQPEVRQALEAALPKLREMMNEAGIQLGQATVGAEQQQQQQNEAASREARRMGPAYPGANDAAESTLQSMPLPLRQSGRGLVDTFA
ncbi:MAG: flagellar hook-length control protein FliK [Thiobacillus sp.]|nr:flagellar hook-length control protein FliK [Thiobacillus sp.]